MFKNITPAKRVVIDLIIAITSLAIAYYLPDTVWPFIPTVLGLVGIVYLAIFVIDLVKLQRVKK